MRRNRRRTCSLRQNPRESRFERITLMGVELKIETIEGTRSLTERDSELLETSQM